jgi:phage host-nuclease inhibitor protein Gam
MMKRIGELKAERVHDLNQIGGLQEENARLKAEVERLGAFRTHTIIPNEKLQAEVERLTKAGDAMALAMAVADRSEYGGVSDPIEDYLKARKEIKDWNAAKEGKSQS